MIIMTKTPFRVSLVGGGTDLPSFYKKAGYGAVVSFTINKFMYIIVKERFECDKSIRVSYSMTEVVDHVEHIQHDLVRECMKRMNVLGGVEIVSIADIPGRGTGLGSSSAFCVGLLNALAQYCVYNYIDFDPVVDVEEEAWKIEIDILKKPIGKQDHVACTYGGINYIRFNADESIDLQRIKIDPENIPLLEENLMLFYTGITRPSSDVLEEQSGNIVRDEDVMNAMLEMRGMTNLLADDLEAGDIQAVGKYLDKNWELKRSLASKISNPKIDKWYAKALRAGATGGKVLGAGGGGFMLLFVPPDFQTAVRLALSDLCEVPFKIEMRGTRLSFMEGFND